MKINHFKKQKEMIFGIHAIHEAIISSDKSIAKIWLKRTMNSPALQELLVLAQQHSIPCNKVPVEKLNRLTNGNHQGAIALISPIHFFSIEQIIQHVYETGKQPCIVILDHLQDMHNFGAIIRSAVATGINGIIMNNQKSLPITADAIKTSAGTIFHMPICRTNNLLETLKTLQHSGLQIVACSEQATQTMYEINLTHPTAFVFGGEHEGIAEKHLKQCNAHIRIPMCNNINSLNISVATSVILYEWMRQQTKK